MEEEEEEEEEETAAAEEEEAEEAEYKQSLSSSRSSDIILFWSLYKYIIFAGDKVLASCSTYTSSHMQLLVVEVTHVDESVVRMRPHHTMGFILLVALYMSSKIRGSF